ncbi:MAG: helix-turn-helix transcriptional regulator [Candidatus Rokuibacteriota bacterium]
MLHPLGLQDLRDGGLGVHWPLHPTRDVHSRGTWRDTTRDKGCGQCQTPRYRLDYYISCDILLSAMNSSDLKSGRSAKGLSQVQAATRLRVSQPYLAMLESGRRRLTPELARRAMKVYDLPPTVLPPSELLSRHRVDAEALANDVAALGYPGFAYLRPRNWKPKNPSDVLLAALAQDDLEARLVEALPWLVLRYWPLDREWLVREAKLRDLQNRLGFVVSLARRLAERARDERKARALNELETELERSRLAREDTLCKTSLSEPERRWLAENRPEDAKHWNVLTDWTVDALRYVA